MNIHNFEARYILSRLSPSAFTTVTYFSSFVPIFGSILLVVILATALLFLLLKLIQLKQQLSERTELLELTPPEVTEKNSYTTEQLFSLIHALGKQRSFWEKILGYKNIYSLEIVSTHNEGIRYLSRIPVKDVNTFKRSLLSYLPQLEIKSCQEYLPDQQITDKGNLKVVEFTLSSHFGYPLKKLNELSMHDPIAYITGMMTKLHPGELVSLQIGLSPSKTREIFAINNLILRNGDLLEYLNSHKTPGSAILRGVVTFFFTLYSLPFWLISNLATNGNTPFPKITGTQKLVKENKTAFEQDLTTAVHTKINQPVFEVFIRLLLLTNDKKDLYERYKGIVSSFSTFSFDHYQSLVSVRIPKWKIFNKYLLFVFRKRIFGLSKTSVLSLSEVSDLYHFPFTRMTKTEDIVKQHSKQLPAPLSLKKAQDLDIIFANNRYGGTTTGIGLTQDERRRHMYILGATGTGKSTLLLSMIKQDMEHGKGLCVIDPHGELVENILQLIPDDRIKDVIYFNPDDISFPVGLNLLELPTDVTGDLLLREKELIAESIISLFHKIYDDKYSGPRMEYILRNTIHTAFTTPNPTLFTVYKLLINDDFRKKVTASLQDPNLSDFWKYEFSKAGDYQKVKMISPITNKIGRFLFSPIAKRILEQEKSTINFDDIMDSGKILLCNVSKGKIGEDNSQVFGALIMTKIQLAALKRARVASDNRRDFYLYVDEFQNFATPSFAQILSEARKYRLNAILAHQTTSQLEDKSLVNVTLANTGTVICFRTANPEDERLILPQFIPYVQLGEIDNLPSFHFYIKISALHPEEPFSGETVPVSVPINEARIKEIIQASRKHFATEFIAKPPEVFREQAKADKEKSYPVKQQLGLLP